MDYVLAFKTSLGYTGTAFSTLVTHELGHLFRLKYAGDKSDDGKVLGEKWEKYQNIILQGEIGGTWRHASAYSGSEMFSDMFTAWVYGAWNPSDESRDLVTQASSDMDSNMKIWIP
jgi:hypothetical protein